MPKLLNMQCPKCGKPMSILPEAAKIGVVCPNCKAFVGDGKEKKMSEEEINRITAALHELLKK